MSGNIKNVCDHIKNVRNSLKNAEDSFRSNNDMRGELDLMLAEAEMQHLRERRGFAAVWTRQRLAVVAAFLLVLTGAGGWFWAKNSLPSKPADIVIAQTTIMPDEKKIPRSASLIESAPEKIKTQSVIQDEPQVLPQKTQQVEKAGLQVPENEVRNLVRTARKTLNDSN
ncbi:MAG: hypothetical protein GX451_12295 [Acholeplasmataceae bacterium]|nr:hypothetical protein [Acholeplasmataceae bacterium]